MRLTINGHGSEVVSAADVQLRWEGIRSRQFSEVWLEAGENGPSLTMLINGEFAWLMYLRTHEGDVGFSSRNPQYSGPPDARMEFMLDNGQRDEYPVAWTVPLEQALRACAYFVSTRGDRAPDIVWHDDAIGDDARDRDGGFARNDVSVTSPRGSGGILPSVMQCT